MVTFGVEFRDFASILVPACPPSSSALETSVDFIRTRLCQVITQGRCLRQLDAAVHRPTPAQGAVRPMPLVVQLPILDPKRQIGVGNIDARPDHPQIRLLQAPKATVRWLATLLMV